MRRSGFTTRVLTVRGRLQDESGIALVMALGIMLVLTIALTAVITFTAAGARDAGRVNAGQQAYALAEAGVNNALAVLNANYPDTTTAYPGPRCLLNPQTPPADFPGVEPGLPACASSTPFTSMPDSSRPNETVTWWGRLRNVPGMGITWVINSTGSVPNPTGPGAAAVTRTIRAKVPVVIGDPVEQEPGVLEWLYSVTSATALQSVEIKSPFYTRGNLTLGNGVDVYAPLYVTCVPPTLPVPTTSTPCPSTAGNILMENTGKVHQGATPGAVTVSVGGRLTQTSNQNYVGTNAARIGEAHVVNGCESKTRAYNVACEWDLHDVFVSGTKNFIMPPDPVPNPPVIDWPFWYQYSSPGPTWGCDSGTTPMLESVGSTTLNNSVPSVFNLVPTTSYSCKTLSGELSYNAATRTLTIDGSIFIDGSAKIEVSGPGAVLYQGKGTLYVGGSFLFKNTELCAVIDNDTTDGSPCNLGAWDPQVSAFVIVAKSRGSDPGVQAAAGNNSLEVVSADFQGVLSGEYDIVSTTTSVIQGPIISFQGGLNISQTSGASFPDIRFPPAGAPGTPPPPTELLPPREFGGG